MNIPLTQDQRTWIAEQVAPGRYASVQVAPSQLIDERIAALEIEDDVLAWAKPLVDQALADVAVGGLIILEEHRTRNRARLAAPKG